MMTREEEALQEEQNEREELLGKMGALAGKMEALGSEAMELSAEIVSKMPTLVASSYDVWAPVYHLPEGMIKGIENLEAEEAKAAKAGVDIEGMVLARKMVEAVKNMMISMSTMLRGE